MIIIIQTSRLILKPLNADELLLAVNSPDELDKHLNLNIRYSHAPEGHIRKALEYRRKMVMEHPAEYMWYSEWELIEAAESRIIGGIMLMPERKDGEVEIGYGIDEKHQNKGYKTEAVSALINWMFENSAELMYVVAETEKDNTPSQKVVIKAGMLKYKETDACYWWRTGKNS